MWQRGAKIKTRESVKNIKDLDKAEVAGERMNKATIRSKDATKNRMDDGKVSPSEYAEDKIWYVAENVVSDTGQVIRKETDKAVEKIVRLIVKIVRRNDWKSRFGRLNTLFGSMIRSFT